MSKRYVLSKVIAIAILLLVVVELSRRGQGRIVVPRDEWERYQAFMAARREANAKYQQAKQEREAKMTTEQRIERQIRKSTRTRRNPDDTE